MLYEIKQVKFTERGGARLNVHKLRTREMTTVMLVEMLKDKATVHISLSVEHSPGELYYYRGANNIWTSLLAWRKRNEPA